MLAHLERLRHYQALALPPGIGGDVHQNRLLKIAREGAQLRAWDVGVIEDTRRHATLVALALDGRASVTDEIIDLHDRIMIRLVATAKHKYRERFLSEGREINDKVRLYATVGQALVAARDAEEDAPPPPPPPPFAAIEGVIGAGGVRRERRGGRTARPARLLRSFVARRRSVRHPQALHAALSRRAPVRGGTGRARRARRDRDASADERGGEPERANRCAHRVRSRALETARVRRARSRAALLRDLCADGVEERAPRRRHLGRGDRGSSGTSTTTSSRERRSPSSRGRTRYLSPWRATASATSGPG